MQLGRLGRYGIGLQRLCMNQYPSICFLISFYIFLESVCFLPYAGTLSPCSSLEQFG
ncbi:hypothetical protein BDW59DRAFT_139516 [Aspergillus cavernicola]|uniref:Uncharacterized protein n=1 Tax=Aspergillus cavernicola TaxID=176166 RepID=A0ABR4IYP9_9EURO